MTTTIPQVSTQPLTQTMTTAGPNPQELLLQAGLSYITSACLQVAVKLGIADLIGDTERDVKELALSAGVDEDYLFRVLRVLEMNQLVARRASKTFVLTPAGALLRSDVPGSFASAMQWLTDPLHFEVYSKLAGSVERGKTTFDGIYGEPFFRWLSRKENTEEAQVFNDAMTSISEMCVPAFLEAYDFSVFDHLVDVGGGHGALLRAILRAAPRLRGTVADMPTVVPEAQAAIEVEGLTHRCTAVECDFFAGVPEGGDAYLLKHIVHDWSDAQAVQLLKNIRAVIPQHGKLILAEAVLDGSAAPHPGKLLDIEMMAFVGGKERTEEQFRELLKAAGFALTRVVPTKSPLCLVEAVPC